VQNINESVQGCIGFYTAELVFDFDEVGISDWEDRKARKAVVPTTMGGQTIAWTIVGKFCAITRALTKGDRWQNASNYATISKIAGRPVEVVCV
jgi:hypothetical protein